MATTTHSTERRYTPDRRANGLAKRSLSAIDWLALALVIIGALNWGLVGAFDFDLVAAIFGEETSLSRLVYALVGLAALWTLYTCSKLSHRKANGVR